MGEFLHYDNGKGKSESHEVYIDADISAIGYGATKQEAFQDFIGKLDDYIEKLKKFREEALIDDAVRVDCFGKRLG
ncbi:hypothetical protein [Paenibacillus sp. L3-i20]|uniref:hypothetical protein n=1 Tax=Paenibacillus sp. L3-i20 TaxID=2905833 RepID=UPI001EDDD9EC|nr:hypothetical protein [Paenibacillus sp. L3-i20]GKU79323.1 hypothetical protein L3i20_v237200 [Paenibacillus sp. L3-i20]